MSQKLTRLLSSQMGGLGQLEPIDFSTLPVMWGESSEPLKVTITKGVDMDLERKASQVQILAGLALLGMFLLQVSKR